MSCPFCNRVITNPGSLVAHTNQCVHNPNRVFYSRSPNAGAQKGSSSPHRGKKVGRVAGWDKKYPLHEVMVGNSTYHRKNLKKRLIDEGIIPYVCACCNTLPEWQGKPLVLILDHINGVNNDHRLENLRFVCPNCDSQSPTFAGKNKKGFTKDIPRNKYGRRIVPGLAP